MSSLFRMIEPPEQMKDWAIAIVRMIVGFTFVMHGWQKFFDIGVAAVVGGFTSMGVPMPELTAPLVTFVELICGFALMIGLATRLVAIPLAIDMLAAIVLVQIPGGFFAPQGVELVLLLFTGAFAMMLGGPGALSVDRQMSGMRTRIAFAD
jgi:putative oxidoreductase